MDDAFGFIIFVLIFVLGPVLEQLRKKGQQQKQPPTAPPRPLPQRQPQPLPRSTTEEVSAKPRESAAAMVPDDLWAVLTGEARPPAPAPTQTLPQAGTKNRPWDVVYIPPEEIEDEEGLGAENTNVEVERTSREAVLREHSERHRPVEAVSLEVTQANIISLEAPPQSSAARHAAFHERVDAKPVAAKPARRRLLVELGSREELQRAFVLQEVLGTPRGLE